MSAGLRVLNALPDGFLEVAPTDILRVCPAPTLIHLPGDRAAPVFVSVLLHGNETTGFEALQRLLRQYQGRSLPRAISIFVGNVEAAAQGERVLAGQADFNRIWPDENGSIGHVPDTHAASLTRNVMNEMLQRSPFCSLDLHNTSGRNPHHACVTSLLPQSLRLASMFSRQLLYFETPKGVQNMAFQGVCPAMTAECGLAGSNDTVVMTSEFLDRCLHLDALPDRMPVAEFELYRSVATVKVPTSFSMSFEGEDADIRFVPEIDGYNWREIPEGTELAQLSGRVSRPLHVRSVDGTDVWTEFLLVNDEKLLTKRALVPAMLSLEENIVRQDCLCYFLERVS